MARVCSQNLRDRVIDAAFSGMSARRAADRFGIGLATAIRWVRQARETGIAHPAVRGSRAAPSLTLIGITFSGSSRRRPT